MMNPKGERIDEDGTFERRSKSRTLLEVPITVRGYDRKGRLFTEEGKVQNLSPTGAYLVIRRTVREGQPILAAIQLKEETQGERPLCVVAQSLIVRCEALGGGFYGYGIKFVRKRFL